MARLFAFLLFVAGVARVWFDWQATIAIAAPFRFATLAAVWEQLHPNSFEKLSESVPVLMNAPLVPVLFGLAVLAWIFRKKR